MPLWNFCGAKRQVEAVKSHSKVSSEEKQMSDRSGQDAILDKTGKTSEKDTLQEIQMRGENKQRGQERGENSGGREGTASSEALRQQCV